MFLFSGNLTIGRWRLIGSTNAYEGRVEYRFDENETWKGVVVDVAKETNSFIENICQQLGYPTYVSYYLWNKFGQGDGAYYHMGHTTNADKDKHQPLGLRCSQSKHTVRFRYATTIQVPVQTYIVAV